MARISNQKVAQDFETRVKTLLENLAFKDVRGGGPFLIGGHEVHAIAGFEDTLLVIRCKSEKAEKTALINAIKKFLEEIPALRSAIQTQTAYKRYKDYRFVIAARFECGTEERAIGLAVASQIVHVWDDGFLSYYERLRSKIDEYAKYNLVGELGIKPRVEHIESFPCLSQMLNRKVRAFMFFAEPTRLLKWAYVARREKGQEHYYQRIVDTTKLNRIAEYVTGGSFFPNGVILAFNANPVFNEFPEVRSHFPDWREGLDFGSISFSAEFRSCWIIDGQHRLYGMGRSKVNTPIPVVALQDVKIADQAQLFLDINKNQKPVPPELVWDLEGEMRPNEPDGIISRVVKELNSEGLLAGSIYIPLQGPKIRGQLKLSGICAAMDKQKLNQRLLRERVGNPFFSESADELVKLLSTALQAGLEELDKVFTAQQKQGFWLQNSGIAIFLAIFEKIVSFLRESPSRSDFKRYFAALAPRFKDLVHGELRELRQRCSSEGGRDNVVREFVLFIRTETGEDDFGGKNIPQSKLDRRITAMERQLADLVAAVLSKTDSNWFKTRVDEGTRKYVESRTGKNPVSPQKEMTLGQILEVLKRKDNWPLFEDLSRAAGFMGLPEIAVAQQIVNDLRAVIFHGKRKLTRQDELLLEGYLGKFEMLASSSP